MKKEYITINFQNKKFQIATNIRRINNTFIVFIHGLGCRKECFDAIWKNPDFNSFSIVAFDLPGH